MENLVYAELTAQITFEMMEDKLVLIISDNAMFLVTNGENSLKYKEEFYPVNAEAVEAYGIEFENGGISGSTI